MDLDFLHVPKRTFAYCPENDESFVNRSIGSSCPIGSRHNIIDVDLLKLTKQETAKCMI